MGNRQVNRQLSIHRRGILFILRQAEAEPVEVGAVEFEAAFAFDKLRRRLLVNCQFT